MFFRVSLAVLATAVVFSLNGCGSDSSDTNSGQTPEGASPTAQAPDDVHPTEGPHGGHLIELGNEEYHAELLHDPHSRAAGALAPHAAAVARAPHRVHVA